MTAAEFEEAKQRTAEADASGEWCTLADVQKHLLPCNPLFANPAHKNLSQWLSVHPLGRGIRRLFDKATESCPAGFFALQRYWLDDVVKVARSYTTRVTEWRFETVDAPRPHLAELCRNQPTDRRAEAAHSRLGSCRVPAGGHGADRARRETGTPQAKRLFHVLCRGA